MFPKRTVRIPEGGMVINRRITNFLATNLVVITKLADKSLSSSLTSVKVLGIRSSAFSKAKSTNSLGILILIPDPSGMNSRSSNVGRKPNCLSCGGLW